MQFSFIQYLLTGICIISAINIILIYKLNTNTTFSYLLKFFNAYLFVHALYVIGVEQFYSDKPWLDRYAPFSLMYGPFLYFAFIAISDRTISIKRVLIHSSPFLLFSTGFLYLLIFEPSSFKFLYPKVLNLTTVVSFSSYTVLGMFLNVRPLSQQFRQRKLVVLAAVILLLFVSIITLVAHLSSQKIIEKPNAIVLLRIMVYSCMLIATIIIFKYKLNIIFFKINNVDEHVEVDRSNVKSSFDQTAKYEKSTLSNKQLDEYSKKLEKLMLSQRVYLATDLSLQKLAQLLRIPNHHLTQVLSLKIRMGFYDYVNGFRVQYACMLLENEPGVNLETIAERSGFNSKVSFNRHFKSILGCTPSHYRAQKKNSEDF